MTYRFIAISKIVRKINEQGKKYRVSQLISRFHCLVLCNEQSLRPRDDGNTSCHSDLASAMLQPKRFNGFGPRAHENHPSIGDSLRKLHVFRQEAIAGNNGVDMTGKGDVDDCVSFSTLLVSFVDNLSLIFTR
jgi:hypothetical protein